MTSQILLFSIFYAGIEENDIFYFLVNLKSIASYLENGLADFVDTYTIFSIFKMIHFSTLSSSLSSFREMTT